MDALNVLLVGAEISSVVGLVLKQYTCDFVADELGGLDFVVVRHQEVAVHASAHDRQHKVCSFLLVAVP